jgi:redox-sensitive bicupin YhaK (pirin superfamily)
VTHTLLPRYRYSRLDDVSDRWVDLHAGDLQVLDSGDGIWHRERVAWGSHVFQILFDPGY